MSKYIATISRKLILYIILFSSLITLIITIVQLYGQYKEDLNDLDKQLQQIEIGYNQGLTNAVWLDDQEQLQAILSGIDALPNIEYIEVLVNDKTYASVGKPQDFNVVQISFPLQYTYDNRLLTIGDTLIEANISYIHKSLLDQAWIVLVSNAIKTFIVAIFMFYLIDRIVIKKLTRIIEFVQHHDINNLENRITITENNSRPDEITSIAAALNSMQEKLSVSLKELLNLKLTLDLTADGVFMFSPDTLKFFYTNRGASVLIGYSSDELFCMTPIDIFPEFNEQRFKMLASPTLSNKNNAVHLETVLQHKHGETIPVNLFLQYIDLPGESDRFVIFAENISERKKTEKLMLASLEEAKAANNEKSRFLMSISHEVRTPLNAILGFGQLLSLDRDKLSDSQLESVKDIIQGGEHLLKIVDDLLDLSKIETDNITLNLENIDSSNLIKECIKIVYPMAVLNDINLQNRVDSSKLPLIYADQTRLKQILINLLTNAIKYNHKNGNVIIEHETLNDNLLRLKVSDTGHGIPIDKQSNVFTAFSRLGYEAGNIEGVGIGLNITKKLIELMGGNIDFKSTAGKGSCFWIDLPYLSQSKTQNLKN